MSKESYLRGFAKVAQATGMNPVWLLKYAQEVGLTPDQVRSMDQTPVSRTMEIRGNRPVLPMRTMEIKGIGPHSVAPNPNVPNVPRFTPKGGIAGLGSLGVGMLARMADKQRSATK